MTLAAAAKPAIGLLAVGMTAGALALATAAPPSAGGDVRTTVIELAATDAPSSSAALAAPTAEPPQGLAAVSGEAPTGQLSDATSAPVAQNTVAAADPAAAPAGQPRAGGAPVTTTAPATIPPTRMATGTFAADGSHLTLPAPAGMVSVDGGTLKVTAPAGTLTLQPSSEYAAPTITTGVAPPLTAQFRYVSGDHTQAASSRAALEIELQYWTLKASGLSKKAEALKLKAGSIDVSSDSEQIMVLEIESEAELTLAEVKHCEAMAQQLKDDLARRQETRTAPSATLAPGAVAPAAGMPPSAVPTLPAPGATYAPPQNYGGQSPQLLTPQNSYVDPANPHVGPAVVLSPTETTPAVQMQYETLSRQITALQAQNERLQRRLEELEGDHEAPPR
jgi:hypothetical protein